MSWGAMAGAMFDSVKQAASSTYDSLSGRPTVVECDKCNKELAVPVNLFMWGCPTCQSINDLDDSMCKKAGCKILQPANPNKQLMACGVCGNHVKVPSTNAGKHAKAGVKMAKAGFSFATASVVKAIADEKVTPTTVTCNKCDNVLGVPEGLFSWTCQRQGCQGATAKLVLHSDQKACPSCGGEEIERASPLIMCAICQDTLAVPRTNMKKHLEQAKKATIGAATFVKEKAIDLGSFIVAKPVQFHCSVCSTLLALPTNAQGQPDLTIQQVCCAQCKQLVNVPSSNFKETAGRIKASVLKFGYVGWYEVSGEPYVKCGTCSTPVKIAANQQTIACGKCNTILAKQN